MGSVAQLAKGVVVLACSGIIAGAALASAQTPAAPAKAGGVPVYRLRVLGVYDADSGDPVEGVEVADVLTGMKSLTTTTGTLSLLFLPEGASFIRVRKIGYEIQTFPVSISPADTQPITAVLKRAVTLPTVNVRDSAPTQHLSPLMQTFEDHRKTHIGQYITEAEFRKYENSTLAQFVGSRLSGLSVVNLSSKSLIVSSRTPCKGGALARCTSPNCYVSVYIDGIRTFDSTMPVSAVPDISRISTMDYSAAEFYPSAGPLPGDIPASNSQCGTLMLYSRYR
ncbi:MAG: hypothetical protein ACHQWU_01125 [Gemmatimonadales bacterium]